ncbi:MAG: phosphoglyceromutase [Saprospiraceae bacterium]|nr:phosphoglyceromutase [Saprospiraceae bacterium]
MKNFLLSGLLLSLTTIAFSQSKNLKTENVFIITLDGLRWEELYGGAVDSLMNDQTYVKDTTELQQLFAAATKKERREKLMPWFWNTIGKMGQLYGNRWEGNKANVTNFFWFSYPGYNEILTGFSDTRINSNSKVYNPNVTVLEWLHNMPEYNGRVAAFGSWDVFPYIINDKRSGIPVNAGFRLAEGNELTEKEQFLNKLQPSVPSPWSTVRLDAFTHNYALEYIKKKHPKVVYISYGETDDFAHDGDYDHYLKSAYQTDQWIKEMWETVQADPFYAGKTTFLITTDHGRGSSPKSEWKSHGKTFEGSNAIWMAVIGPDTPAMGEMKNEGQYLQNQVAKTAAAFLGLNYDPKEEEGQVIKEMFKK